jgi:hypothetical protein
VDGKPLRTEFTLLPGTKTITWDGQRVETVVLQYLNFLDGRIEEVAPGWASVALGAARALPCWCACTARWPGGGSS